MLGTGSTLAIVLLVVCAVGMLGWRTLVALAAAVVVALVVVGFVSVMMI